ncbi:hypothetical protein N0V90_001330 [Kalmusia sp. IMI 367209]|nr:hypothetical protein N0V90_001330 [Kalmusia sp. IMI 367209]
MKCLNALLVSIVFFGYTALATSVFDLFGFEKDHLSDKDLDALLETSPTAFRSAATETQKCKTSPGDLDWPTELMWQDFNTTLSGALIETIPEAALCYGSESTTEAQCQALTSTWGNSSLRIEDPTSIRALLFQGQTCLPPSFAPAFLYAKKTCTMGGYPAYTVNVTNVAQIQLAVRFAKVHNIRLVIKNTGHDFLAKSTGMGGLNIWTHHLKQTRFNDEKYGDEQTGPAVRLGAGVQVFEAYELAKRHNVSLVGGEGRTVGLVGGYSQGGGHSPLSSLYGLAADHTLSISLVTSTGTFLTANSTHFDDLFWALRGGGGGTFAIVTSMVIKALPQMKVTTMRYNLTTNADFTHDQFWEMQKAYLDDFEYFADLGYYSYYRILHVGGEISHDMTSWVAPNTSESDFRASIAPLLDKWTALGVPAKPIIKEYDNFADAWAAGFPQEPWTWNMRQASRFFPRVTISNATSRAASLDAIRSVFDAGARLIMFNMRNPPGSGSIDNAVNPAWRDVLLFAIMFVTWNATDSTDYVTQLSRNVTYEWNPRWKALTPGSGTYLSEADYIEPGWQESFHGAKYGRLLEIKRKWDPEGVFWASEAVGSEEWELSEVLLGHLPSQNSKLCRK